MSSDNVEMMQHKVVQDAGTHHTHAFFWYSPYCALKFLSKFRKNDFKNYLKKWKNPSKRCSNSVFPHYFKNGTNEYRIKECGSRENGINFWETALIRRLKYRIFNSMTVILCFSFHMLSYFWVIPIA